MDWKNFFKLVEDVAPTVLRVIPGVPPVLIPVIIHGIQVAESIPGADGPTKKASVIDLVTTTVTATNAAAGKQVIDPSVTATVSTGIDTTVGVINLIHGNKPTP